MARSGPAHLLRRALVGIVVGVVVTILAGCSVVFETQSPIRFDVDRRLDVLEPEDEARLSVPVTIRWTAGDFSLTGGRQFAVFLDHAPVGLTEPLRLRVCTEWEQRPVVAGEARRPCHDDRKRSS